MKEQYKLLGLIISLIIITIAMLYCADKNWNFAMIAFFILDLCIFDLLIETLTP